MAHNLIKRDGIDNGLFRYERLVQYLRVLYAIDDERAADFPHMAIRLDAPFALVEEQYARVHDTRLSGRRRPESLRV